MLGSFLGCPQRPSRGLKRGDTEIRNHGECSVELAAGKSVCDSILLTRDMENTKVDVIGEQDVDGAAKEVVIGWKASERAENLNGVQIVGEDDHSCTAIQALGSVSEGAEDTESLEIEDGGGVGVQRGGCIETEVRRRIPETHTLRAGVAVHCQIRGGDAPVRGFEEVDAAGSFDVTSCPSEVLSNRVVHPDFAAWVMVAAELRVEVVEARPEEREDVKGPI